MGLIARSPLIASVTTKPFDQTGVDFTRSAPHLDLPSERPSVLYRMGVLFAGDLSHKREEFSCLLTCYAQPSSCVIIVDDSPRYLIDMEAICYQLDFEFTAYGYCP